MHKIRLFHRSVVEIQLELNILRSDWMKACQPISQKPDFSQIWDVYMNIANNINFHYKLNSDKINGKAFQ